MKLKKMHIGFVLVLLLALAAYIYGASDDDNVLANDDFIRFHVVANSDSVEDQKNKLLVRDGLLNKINDELVTETMSNALPVQDKVVLDIDRTKEFIQRNLTELEREAVGILSKLGCNDPVKAELGIDYVPKKTYGNIAFPAGSYNSLKVTIGDGRGENWWCVLFPPLCLIDAEQGNNKAAADIYKEAILDDKYKRLIETTEKPKTLKLKFKVLEMIKSNT
ncbi:MAG TPA: stage II sporulation protein R [Anaerovoracaceae bacterium]|nr:stage II sporulation protein R [Anaerovoracaceae bacterium]